MYSIVIIDDEYIFQNKIKNTINKTLMNEPIEYKIHVFSSAEDYLKHTNFKSDIIFLDIEMREMNGIDLSKQIDNTTIVFVTSHDEYVRQAYGKNIIAYLFKDEINEILPKILMSAISSFQKETLPIKTEDGICYLQKSDISYFYIENRKIYAHIYNKNIRIYTTSLVKIKTYLGENFYKINDYYLVNLDHVNSICNSSVYVKDDSTPIPIPKGKVKLIKSIILEYKKERNHS